MVLAVDLLELGAAGARWATDLGEVHLESESQLSLFLVGLAALAGSDLWAVGAAGDLQLGFEQLSHELFAGVGVGFGAVGVIFLDFMTMLLGQLSFRPAGIFDLYFGFVSA
jgi:hypothetical protein